MSELLVIKEPCEVHLRHVDLNLLTVFDAVMQVQNITRAAQSLGMSQPAVSNAVARLKVMFNDELFVRYGRGIQPTVRARQLFGPVRQALQLVLNELPGAGFEPHSSEKVFNISICSPLDIRLSGKIFNFVTHCAPHVQLKLTSTINDNIEHQLRYQEMEFVIGYNEFENPEFHNEKLFEDELIAVVSANHQRVKEEVSRDALFAEKHAVVMLDRMGSFSAPFYESMETRRSISSQSTDLSSVLNIVSQTDMVALVPRWLAQEFAEPLKLELIPLPWMKNTLSCNLSWHESAGKDKAHQWMRTLLSQSGTSL